MCLWYYSCREYNKLLFLWHVLEIWRHLECWRWNPPHPPEWTLHTLTAPLTKRWWMTDFGAIITRPCIDNVRRGHYWAFHHCPSHTMPLIVQCKAYDLSISTLPLHTVISHILASQANFHYQLSGSAMGCACAYSAMVGRTIIWLELQ